MESYLSYLPNVPKIRINFPDANALQFISGLGPKLAKIMVDLRESHGNVKTFLLTALFRKKLEPEVLACLDFAPNPTYWEGEDKFIIFAEGPVGGGGGGGRLVSDTELMKTQIRKEITSLAW